MSLVGRAWSQYRCLLGSRLCLRRSVVVGAAAAAVWTGLDPSRKRQLRISISGLVRFIRTLSIGTVISLDYWYSIRTKPQSLSECHSRCAHRILTGCLLNGGIYVKLGQGLVALNHILPEEYLDVLEVLHDRALRDLPFSEVEEVFREDFGFEPQELFSTFDVECVAAASLAQVFHAVTKAGEDVAVKIQYSDLRQRFQGDLWALGVLVSLVGWMHPAYNFRWVLDYLRESLVNELDFELEAKNMKICASHLKNLKYVKVPTVVDSLTSKRVLTMEWIDGIKINQKPELIQRGYSLYDIDHKLITAFSQQIFRHGFLHADPHPGNVLVARNKNNPSDPFLVLLDHGLYENLSTETRLALCSLWRSIVLNDDAGMKKFSSELGVPRSRYRIFCEILVQRPLLFRQRSGIPLSKGLSATEMNYMKEMAVQRFDEIMECLKALPRPMLLVFRNINIVRSIAKTHGHPVDRFAVMARLAGAALIEYRCQSYAKAADRKHGFSLTSLAVYSIWRMVMNVYMQGWQTLQLELHLVIAWYIDWFIKVYERVARNFNRDLDHLALEIEETRRKRERYFA